ncbi:hypothetical protein C2S53_016973 [Perilla frutescens var. hirtella]|uniref:Uncharacterized protein n=1 Tax=Perilla frutescens var. hirtella TaxID=608512 RepID=A0AAD4JKT7_PERFH|nr:hypothetical protein C2S53_016973 [Perilla frutescens var. hirtella]
MSKGRIPKSVSINLDQDGNELRRGPWTLEEDNLLIQHITSHGEGQWNSLAKSAGLKRTGKSCRLRWLNYLKPDIKRGNLAPHEQLLILELHSRWGNRWSKIAQHMPGRTDNEIKNYWRTRVQKQARQLKVDSNSKKFLEAVRLYWMPRLLEKIEQDSSPSSSAATSSPSSSSITTSETPKPAAAPPPPQINRPVLPNSGEEIQEISGFLTPAGLEPCGKIFCGKPFEDGGCYHVDIPGYDHVQELGCEGMSMSECHAADDDWFGSCFWNSDELWQFRKLEEVDV